MNGFYDLSATSIDGTEQSMGSYKDKVVLIVNVASECGLTDQYKGLQGLYQKYRDRGFEILAFPCNQFGGQEPGAEASIKAFCETKYAVSFPLFSKIEVNGEGAHALYRFLKSKFKKNEGSDDIEWNFAKFIVDREGQVVDRLLPQVTPEQMDEKIGSLI